MSSFDPDSVFHMAERTSGLYRLITIPNAYSMVQHFLAGDGAKGRVADLLFSNLDGKTVCEVGCGPASWAKELQKTKDYIGVDWNKEHVEFANKTFGDEKMRFIHADITDPATIDEVGVRDVVIGMGILHHLDDVFARRTLTKIAGIIKSGGRYLGLENVYHENQHLIARLLNALDSGKNVRNENGYRQIFDPDLYEVRTSVRTDLMRVPYSHILIDASRR